MSFSSSRKSPPDQIKAVERWKWSEIQGVELVVGEHFADTEKISGGDVVVAGKEGRS
jgi:hypothetical protein